MIEITAEIRAFIDKAAAGAELAEDEYIDPSDGLIHCKKCGGQRQTVVSCFEFMTIDTPLPPCMAFPRALTGFPVSSTAKVMYCRMLDAMLSNGQEDENGILFVCFPVTAIAAVLSRSPMTVKRSLNELETAGLIMRVRQGVGEPNRIYVLIPGKEDAALA